MTIKRYLYASIYLLPILVEKRDKSITNMIIMLPQTFMHFRVVKKRGEEKGKGKEGRISGEEEGNVDYGRMVEPNQQHVVLCVKGVVWGSGTRGLRMENENEDMKIIIYVWHVCIDECNVCHIEGRLKPYI